jgi:hypothetical protein
MNVKILITVIVVVLANYGVSKVLQHDINVDTKEMKELNSELVAARNCKAELLTTNNQLCLRDRICSYATTNLGLVNATDTDSTKVGEVVYVKESNKDDNNIVYSLIDFITPDMQAITE